MSSAYFEPKEQRQTDRFAQFSVASAALALEDAGELGTDPLRTGVIYGTGVGGLQTQIGRFLLHFARIQHGLDAVERRGQCRDLIGGIAACHAGKPNRAQTGSPHPA